MDNTKLIAALEGATEEDNALDVLCEVALFEPNSDEKSIRANAAGTKIIVTHSDGKDVTYWAEPWSNPDRKPETIAALRAREAQP